MLLNTAIYKYKSMSNAVKASIWFAICGVVQKGISFLTVPLFTRLLTTNQYGQVSVFNSWYSLISIFATLNLSYGVFNNGMTKYADNRNKFMSSMQGLSSLVTFILLIIYLAFHDIINDLTGMSTLMILVMFLELFTAPALAFWSARQRYEFKYIALVSITVVIAVLSPVLAFVAVLLSSERGLAKIIATAAVNICIGLFFYVFNGIKGKSFFDKNYWCFALGFNIPLIPHYLSMIVLSQSDRIMIQKMFGESQVAIYSVAYTFSLVMNIVTSSINSSYIPWTYQKLSNKEYNALKKTSNLLILGVAAVSLVPVIIAPEMITIIAPPVYKDAIWIIPPVSTSIFFTFIYNLYGNVEFYFEKTSFIMIASIIGALTNIILNLIFMPKFGYIAAGYTTMFCYMLFAVAHCIFMHIICQKNLNMKTVYEDKIIFYVSVVYLCIIAFLMFTFNKVFIRYSILFILFIVTIIKYKQIKEIVNKIKEGKKTH